MYLSSVSDALSHNLFGWKLCFTIRAEYATETLQIAFAVSRRGLCRHAGHAETVQRRRDPVASPLNGLDWQNIWHRPHPAVFPRRPAGSNAGVSASTILESHLFCLVLELQIETCVEPYYRPGDHKSLDNVTTADASFGRAAAISKQRELATRRWTNIGVGSAAKPPNNTNPKMSQALR